MYASQARERALTGYVGMILFLGSWVLLFGSLFFAYGLLRLQATHWPPVGLPRLPLLLPGVASAVLFCSGVALEAALRIKESLKARGFFVLSLLLGSLFLSLQAYSWSLLWSLGLQLDSEAYGGLFYALTIMHALHVLAGLLALLYFAPQVIKHGPQAVSSLQQAALFWHFMGGVWLLMYLALYVL